MPLKSTDAHFSGRGLRPLLITALILAYPSLGACSQSGSGNESAASSQAPAQNQAQPEQSGGAMGGNMGGNMGSGMNNKMGSGQMGSGMADSSTQSAGGEKPTQVAQADTGSSDSGGNGGEQKREPMDGYTVYSRFCVMCHKTGMNGAPKYGNHEAWAPRIAKGKETLYNHALHGFRGMPPKGGIAGLYEQEVKDAVNYMVKAGGGWDSASK